MNQTPARWTPLRVFALLLLFALVPLGAGCGFGPQVDVPADAQQALSEGQKKVTAAQQAAKGSAQEATRLYDEAATYYGAIARQFSGTENGLRALITQAEIYETGAKNPNLALQTYRNALRQYPPTSFPALHQTAQQKYDALISRTDQENARTPYYQVIDTLVRLSGGSHVLAIFVISLAMTLLLWPLRAKQYRGMKEMQRHAPELKKIQEKYKDDRPLQQEKIMEFYREHGFNPMAGCLPLIAQMPILWGMYHAISLYQYQFTTATFLWINPTLGATSMQWPSPLTGALGRNLGEQDIPLLFIYAVSFYFQTKLNPVTDPTQAEQQKVMAVMMPAMTFVMMLQWHLPSAFVLYWFLSNAMSVAQQWWMNRNVAPLTPVVVADGGAPAKSIAPQDAPPNTDGNGHKPTEKSLAPDTRLISPKNRKNRKK